MPVPKKRTSAMKRDQRRRSHKVATPSTNVCPNCKSIKRPHHICSFCGHYAGRLILQ